MKFDDAYALLARELGARPAHVEVVRVHLWASRMTPGHSDVLKRLIADHPGDCPLEVVLHNGTEGLTVLAPPVTVDPAVREAVAETFGRWAV